MMMMRMLIGDRTLMMIKMLKGMMMILHGRSEDQQSKLLIQSSKLDPSY